MRLWICALAALAVSGLGSRSVWADEVVFNNGDKLTGTVVSAEDGKLKIKSAVAGTVEVSLADVKTFSSTAPITIRLKDGTVIAQPVTAAEQAGEVAIQPGAIAGQNIPISSIRSINLKESWTGSVVAGALLTRGNSDTDAFNLSVNALRRSDVDRINLEAQYTFARQRDQDTGEKTTSADNWRAGVKYDRFLSEKLYAFASIGVEKDRIANLDLRLTPAVGVGYQWVERPDFNFNTEAGLAWVYADYEGEGSSENFSLKLAYHVDKELRDNVSVFHNMTFYPSIQDINDFYLLTDAGIRADLTENFFTEFKVEFRFDNTPAEGSSRDDLRYMLGVGWSF